MPHQAILQHLARHQAPTTGEFGVQMLVWVLIMHSVFASEWVIALSVRENRHIVSQRAAR